MRVGAKQVNKQKADNTDIAVRQAQILPLEPIA